MRHPHLVLALLALPVAFGCSCEDTQAQTIDPVIGLWTDGQPPARLESIDFGQVPTKAKGQMTFAIHAESLAPLAVRSIEFEDDDGGKSAAMFRVSEPQVPFQVTAQGNRLVQLEFTPADPVTYNARVVVKSDDPEKPVVKAALTGLGTEGDIQVWVCADESCNSKVDAPGPYDMGPVYQGDAISTLVTVFNAGLDRLQVTSFDFEDPEAAKAAGFTMIGGGKFSVAKRSSKTVQVDFKPDATKEPGPASVTLLVNSLDRDQPELRMQLDATSLPNHAPVACIYVKQIERFVAEGTRPVEHFQPGDPIPVVEPLDIVTIGTDVRPGCTGDPDGNHGSRLTRLWRVEGPEPSVKDMGPEELRFETQISGSYEISLQVTDPLGLVGTADEAGIPAELTLDVRPVADIAVEVSWSPDADPNGMGAALVDLDAHLVRNPTGPIDFLGINDCAQDCAGKNWGKLNDPEDNPRQLGMDDNGFGKLTETLLLDRPEEGGRYLVGAHYFADQRQVPGAKACASDGECVADGQVCIAQTCRDPVWVRVKVFIKGEETPIPGSPDGRVQLRHPCDFWYAAFIIWNNDSAMVSAIDTDPTQDVPGPSGGGNTCPLD